jgi:hypothetical protein
VCNPDFRTFLAPINDLLEAGQVKSN